MERPSSCEEGKSVSISIRSLTYHFRPSFEALIVPSLHILFTSDSGRSRISATFSAVRMLSAFGMACMIALASVLISALLTMAKPS